MKPMQSKLEEITLSDDFTVYCSDPKLTKKTFSQVNDYFKHGITFKEGDVIFDVGANIGLFSLWIHHHLQGRVSIYAFEPAPETFRILNVNSQLFSKNGNDIKAYNTAILDREDNVCFTYYPKAPTLSSESAYDNDDKKMFLELVTSNLTNDSFIKRVLCHLPSSVRNMIVMREINKLLKPSVIQCKSKTISQILTEENIQRIDLLKVDVEKSEDKVISGIVDNDWGKILSTVIEVHDYDNRVDAIISLLKSNEFNVTVEQEEGLRGTNIYTIFATR